MNCKNIGINKIFSIITLIAFIFTNTSYAAPGERRSLFKNKKVDYKKLSTQREESLQKKKAVLKGEDVEKKVKVEKQTKRILTTHLKDLTQINIPSELGRVIEVYQADQATSLKPQATSRLVVHIQDLHTNPEGQLNMASILEILVKDYKLALICSEGAEGVVDTSSVSSFPDAEVREKTARLFIDSGELTGEEYLSITKYPELPIWGIEDKDIYFENIIQFNKIMKFNPQSQVFISQAKNTLEGLRPKIYSKEILELEEKSNDYQESNIETDEYIDYLTGYIQILNLPIDNYKNISILIETKKKEDTIDQSKVMQESQSLLMNLQTVMSAKKAKRDIDILMAKAELFKDQKISPFSFYSYLKDLALRCLPDRLSDYHNLIDFTDYLTKVNSLDSARLFAEIDELTYELKMLLSKNEKQKTLTKALRHINFLEGFFNIKVSNEELDYYLANKEGHKVSWFKKSIMNLTDKTNYIDYNPDLIDYRLEELEEFYKTAKERDIAMIRNATSEIERKNAKVCAMITGGFHTRGLTEMLREKGYSYIVIAPYSSMETDEENYKYLLSGKRKPISELLTELEGGTLRKIMMSAPQKMQEELNERQDSPNKETDRKRMKKLIPVSSEVSATDIREVLGIEKDKVWEVFREATDYSAARDKKVSFKRMQLLVKSVEENEDVPLPNAINPDAKNDPIFKSSVVFWEKAHQEFFKGKKWNEQVRHGPAIAYFEFLKSIAVGFDFEQKTKEQASDDAIDKFTGESMKLNDAIKGIVLGNVFDLSWTWDVTGEDMSFLRDDTSLAVERISRATTLNFFIDNAGPELLNTLISAALAPKDCMINIICKPYYCWRSDATPDDVRYTLDRMKESGKSFLVKIAEVLEAKESQGTFNIVAEPYAASAIDIENIPAQFVRRYEIDGKTTVNVINGDLWWRAETGSVRLGYEHEIEDVIPQNRSNLLILRTSKSEENPVGNSLKRLLKVWTLTEADEAVRMKKEKDRTDWWKRGGGAVVAFIEKGKRPREPSPRSRYSLCSVRTDITEQLRNYLLKNFPQLLDTGLEVAGADLLNALAKTSPELKYVSKSRLLDILYNKDRASCNLNTAFLYLEATGRGDAVEVLDVSEGRKIKKYDLYTHGAYLISENGEVVKLEPGSSVTRKGLLIVGQNGVAEVIIKAILRDLSHGTESVGVYSKIFNSPTKVATALISISKSDNEVFKDEALRSLSYIYYTSLYLEHLKNNGKDFGNIVEADALRDKIETELGLVDSIKEAYPPVDVDYISKRSEVTEDSGTMLFFPLTGGMIPKEGIEVPDRCNVAPKNMSSHKKVALRPLDIDNAVLVDSKAHAYGVHDSLTVSSQKQGIFRDQQKVHHDLGHYPYAGFSLVPVEMPDGGIRLMIQVIQSTGHAHKPLSSDQLCGPGEYYAAQQGDLLHIVWRGEGDKGEIVTDLNLFVQREGQKVAALPGEAHGAIPLGGAMIFSDIVSVDTNHAELSASRLGGAPLSLAVDPVDGGMYIITNPQYTYITDHVKVGEPSVKNKMPFMPSGLEKETLHNLAIDNRGRYGDSITSILNDSEGHSLFSGIEEIFEQEGLGSPLEIIGFNRDMKENFETTVEVRVKRKSKNVFVRLYRFVSPYGPYLIIGVQGINRDTEPKTHYLISPFYMHKGPIKIDGKPIEFPVHFFHRYTSMASEDQRFTAEQDLTSKLELLKDDIYRLRQQTDQIPASEFFTIVRQLKEDGEEVSFVSICSVSPEVIEAGLRYAQENDSIAFFQVTTNQLNSFDGGYLHMTPEEYIKLVKDIARKVGYARSIFWGGDHIGPWSSNIDRKDLATLDIAMEHTKENIRALLLAGANFIHIDTTLARPMADGGTEDLDYLKVAQRTVELIQASEAIVKENNLEEPVYEIGSDEPGSDDLTDAAGLSDFIVSVQAGLKDKGVMYVWNRVMFIVGNTGTHMKLSLVWRKEDGSNIFKVVQRGFSTSLANDLADVALPYALYPTQHYSDWVSESEGKDIREFVVKVNVGPEFDEWRIKGALDLEEKVNRALSEQERNNERPRYYKSLIAEMDVSKNRSVWEGYIPEEVRGKVSFKRFSELEDSLQYQLILLRSRYIGAEEGPSKALEELRRLAKELGIADDPVSYVSKFIQEKVFARWDKALGTKGLYSKIQNRGSLLGFIKALADNKIKKGTKITKLGMKPLRIRDDGAEYSYTTVAREFEDALRSGFIRATGTKDENGRDEYELLVNFTKDHVTTLDQNEDIRKKLDRGRIRGDELNDVRRAIADVTGQRLQEPSDEVRIRYVGRRFLKIFKIQPKKIAKAPGRGNIIGEHVDYPEYKGFRKGVSLVVPHNYSFSFGSQQNILVAVRPREDNKIIAYSEDYGTKIEIDLDEVNWYTLNVSRDGEDRFSEKNETWKNYFLGAIKTAKERGWEIGGAEIVIQGNVPLAAGMSSSAALCCSLGFAFSDMFNWNLHTSKVGKVKLALFARDAEHKTGSMCGYLDQLSSIFAEEGYASLIDYGQIVVIEDKFSRGEEATDEDVDKLIRHVSLKAMEDKGYKLLLVNSNVERPGELADTDYNIRYEELVTAGEILSSLLGMSWAPHVSCYVHDDLIKVKEQFLQEDNGVILSKRANHVLSEKQRVLDAVDAIEKGDVTGLARAINACGKSLSMNGDFEISALKDKDPDSPNFGEVIDDTLDDLVEVALEEGATAARMMGGGGGGSGILLVKKALDTDKWRKEVTDEVRTRSKTQRTVTFIGDEARPSEGTRVINWIEGERSEIGNLQNIKGLGSKI